MQDSKEGSLMKSYIEESLKFIESDEMRNYLMSVNLKGWINRSKCASIVCFAPASLERKIPVLELIAEQTEIDEKHFELHDPAKYAKQMRIALDERYNNPPGTVFWLQDWYYYEKGCMYGDAFFSEFDAAIRFIKEENDRNAEHHENPEDYYSHSIIKCIPGENGILLEYCEWILSHSGDIWYFDYDYNNKFAPEDWDDIFDYCGLNSNLPVPFQPGDIVIADCSPFSSKRKVLIVDIGDNHDCCAIQCLYLVPNGKFRFSAFKHNSFHLLFRENSHISALYRAKKYNGELTEEEAPLGLISEAIKNDPSIWERMLEYNSKNEHYNHDDENDYHGVKWEPFKEHFGL